MGIGNIVICRPAGGLKWNLEACEMILDEQEVPRVFGYFDDTVI